MYNGAVISSGQVLGTCCSRDVQMCASGLIGTILLSAGGSLPADLFTPMFFTRIRGLMSPDGVLAVNYFGREDGNLAAVLCALRSSGFSYVRAFAEQAHSVGQGMYTVLTAYQAMLCNLTMPPWCIITLNIDGGIEMYVLLSCQKCTHRLAR